MKRYVFKINNSTFVSELDWLAMVIPIIRTNSLENALLVTDEYLNENVYGDGRTRLNVISEHYPHIKLVPVKIVLDEDFSNQPKEK